MITRFLVPAADPGALTVRLPDAEAHHLARVLRLGLDAPVGVFNGRGGEWEGRVTAIDRSGVTVALDRPLPSVPEPGVRLTLGIGLLKGDQMDTIVRDATALGAHAIVPIASAHVTVPERAWRSGRAVERWQRVAVASAKQCGRAVVPEVAGVATLDEMLAPPRHEVILVALEPGAADMPGGEIAAAAPPRSALVLVGPEGGWAAQEIERFIHAGARMVRLGPRTLRAETVPTVLLSSLWTHWGW